MVVWGFFGGDDEAGGVGAADEPSGGNPAPRLIRLHVAEQQRAYIRSGLASASGGGGP